MKPFLYGTIAILAIAGIIYGATRSSSSDEKIVWPSGAITADEKLSHDWGDINIKGGTVEHVFTLTNESEEPLVIQTASTSCMCTSVTIDIQGGKNSPTFGMHNNPKNWNAVVEPGETFDVNVVFDPMAHGPDAVGPIQRSIFIATSAAPDNILTKKHSSVTDGSLLEILASGNVLYEKDYEEKIAGVQISYPKTIGNFAFAEIEHDFGVVKQGAGIQIYKFPFVYNGSSPLTISSVVGSCACTAGSVDVEKLEKGTEGILTIEFDPNLHAEPEGRFFKTISILTDPALETQPEVTMWAEIDLDLGTEAYKLQEHVD